MAHSINHTECGSSDVSARSVGVVHAVYSPLAKNQWPNRTSSVLVSRCRNGTAKTNVPHSHSDLGTRGPLLGAIKANYYYVGHYK